MPSLLFFCFGFGLAFVVVVVVVVVGSFWSCWARFFSARLVDPLA